MSSSVARHLTLPPWEYRMKNRSEWGGGTECLIKLRECLERRSFCYFWEITFVDWRKSNVIQNWSIESLWRRGGERIMFSFPQTMIGYRCF